ncbi:cell division cycle protein 20 homolog B-like isoform X2 [Channa argus]|uniref:cell division cycle protein 20 homolog B-like isoform X2 n=1 Tax=Channa argus TaxID=215402 RepID=UPI003522DA53
MNLTTEESNERDNVGEMFRDSVGKRRSFPFKGPNDAHHVSYKRFRRRIIHGGGKDGPAASTPLTTGWRCESSFELDTICQRLDLDSPPRHPLTGGVSHHGVVPSANAPRMTTGKGQLDMEHSPQRGFAWRAEVPEHDYAQQTGSDVGTHSLPFAVLDKATEGLQGKSLMKLGAPSLLNDYYTHLLDCSCNGIIALALGCSVYLWNSETRVLLGYLGPNPQSGGHHHQTQSVSSLSWSRDGRALCIGTRRGEIQLWDVEQKQSMMSLPSHLSVVRALSWKQQLLSSGSALGRIHHLDVRASTPLVGVAVQTEGVCSLQWSAGGDWLASGSTDGLLHMWDSDVAGLTRSLQPITTMKQPSAVKAMGWCPWQRKMIATGGGWEDGQLRIWDTHTGTCVTSANTNSQICSLRWPEKGEYLVTGHGLPHHQVRMWAFPSLSLSNQFTGHSNRVLHLALNPDSTHIFSAAADQRFHIWEL